MKQHKDLTKNFGEKNCCPIRGHGLKTTPSLKYRFISYTSELLLQLLAFQMRSK